MHYILRLKPIFLWLRAPDSYREGLSRKEILFSVTNVDMFDIVLPGFPLVDLEIE
jgi:hypothetical protein